MRSLTGTAAMRSLTDVAAMCSLTGTAAMRSLTAVAAMCSLTGTSSDVAVSLVQQCAALITATYLEHAPVLRIQVGHDFVLSSQSHVR